MKPKFPLLFSTCFSFMFLFGTISLSAQQEPQYSQFWLIQSVFNPAYSAFDSPKEAGVLFRHQWVGYQPSFGSGGSPITLTGYFNSPYKDKHAFGVNLTSDHMALQYTNKLRVNYAFRQKLGTYSLLSIGTYLGFDLIRFKNGWITNDPNDPNAPSSNQLYNVLNNGLGVVWRNKNLVMGASTTNLVSISSGINYVPHFYFDASYTITAGTDWAVIPRMLVKTTFNSSSTQLSGNCIFRNNNGFWFGSGFIQNEAVSIFGGWNLNTSWSANLGIDAIELGSQPAKSPFSYEIGISYKYDLTKKIVPFEYGS